MARLSVVGSLIVASCVASAYAVNPGLMPGDAFFHSTLTEDALESFGERRIVLEYVYPPDSVAFCGYAGFNRLEIVGDTAAISASVEAVYRALRRDYDLQLRVDSDGKQWETNGFELFVYPKEVKWSRSTVVGLKYNEGWADFVPQAPRRNGKKLPLPKASIEKRYTTFVEGDAAVILDWQFGETVPPLGARYPPELEGKIPVGGRELVATIDAKDIQIVITPCELDDVFRWMTRASDDSGYSFFLAVTSEGVTKWHSGGWDVEKQMRGRLNSEPWSPDDSESDDDSVFEDE